MISIPFYVATEDLEGEIRPLKLYEAPYEAIINIHGYSYHLIFGRQAYGWFLCIPDWRIGAELSHPGDIFWNRESLMRSGADETTANCLSQALRTISKYME